MGTMVERHSHIVIGAGAIGSAAAYWLTERGVKDVLVLEQFDLVNTLNSSGDHSRIIRRVYHSADYTRLTDAMFESWKQVEEHSCLPVYLRTGGLDLTDPAVTPGAGFGTYKQALDEAGVEYSELTASEVRDAYPQWQVSDSTVGLWQRDGGIIDIRRSVSAHTSLAMACGVHFRPRTKVGKIQLHDDHVTVETSTGVFEAEKLMVATGSWLQEHMHDLGLSYELTLSQEQVSYFSSPHLPDFAPERHPIWIYHGQDVYYGFPVYGEAATKIARDMRGHFIASEDRKFDGDDTEGSLLQGFLSEHLPRAAGPALLHKTCVYDMPKDRNFVLDTLPEHPHVAIFNGAGHAGKFASLVGQILSDLLTAGETPHPIEPFSLTRPAITDPGFPSSFRIRAEESGT
ncbi:N-methyl-L-tryptophan oxidase [Garicola koreensis]